MKCQICEEIRGIQSCHIVSRKFSQGTGINIELKNIKEINFLNLCPNHHWYLDNALLTDEEFLIIKDKILNVVKPLEEKLLKNRPELVVLYREWITKRIGRDVFLSA